MSFIINIYNILNFKDFIKNNLNNITILSTQPYISYDDEFDKNVKKMTTDLFNFNLKIILISFDKKKLFIYSIYEEKFYYIKTIKNIENSILIKDVFLIIIYNDSFEIINLNIFCSLIKHKNEIKFDELLKFILSNFELKYLYNFELKDLNYKKNLLSIENIYTEEIKSNKLLRLFSLSTKEPSYVLLNKDKKIIYYIFTENNKGYFDLEDLFEYLNISFYNILRENIVYIKKDQNK